MEALRKYKYSLEHKIALLGEEDPSVGWSKNNIGNAFKGLGKYDEALNRRKNDKIKVFFSIFSKEPCKRAL